MKTDFTNLNKRLLSRSDTNLTWEHFFVERCGVLHEDALKYEKSLIGHRMSPQDTLLESMGLIESVGQIPRVCPLA